jgi:nuclease S1
MNTAHLTQNKILHLILAVSLIGVSPTRTLAWGEKAHRIIAALAWFKLKDEYKAKVRELLGEKTSDPNGPLVAIATWADLRATQYPDERKWHFVDIPLSASAYDEKRDCADKNCILAKLDQKKVELQLSRNRQTRIDALKYIVHLVGDLHQPLHCTDNNDSAGNRVQVKFFGKVTNLHKLWDSDMIERTGLSEEQYVSKLKGIPTSRGNWFADWANDSHTIARKYVYVMSRDIELGQAYYKTNLPVLDRQLATAAEKLAQVLEDALTPPSPPSRRAR